MKGLPAVGMAGGVQARPTVPSFPAMPCPAGDQPKTVS